VLLFFGSDHLMRRFAQRDGLGVALWLLGRAGKSTWRKSQVSFTDVLV